jgi:hypothetical protein
MRPSPMRPSPNFEERKLYHQIHRIKLATDIGSALPFLLFLWHHGVAPALVAGFAPPIIVSGVMMIWPPNLQKLKNSRLGNYVSKYMTPTIEVIRSSVFRPIDRERPLLCTLLQGNFHLDDRRSAPLVIVGLNPLHRPQSPGSRRACQSFSMSPRELAVL